MSQKNRIKDIEMIIVIRSCDGSKKEQDRGKGDGYACINRQRIANFGDDDHNDIILRQNRRIDYSQGVKALEVNSERKIKTKEIRRKQDNG
jgi:hypothetical protein